MVHLKRNEGAAKLVNTANTADFDFSMQKTPVDVFTRSSHRQTGSTTLHGDAQNVGLEEAQQRARHPF